MVNPVLKENIVVYLVVAIIHIFIIFPIISESPVIPFQSILRFYVDASHLICTANQVTGFYMK